MTAHLRIGGPLVIEMQMSICVRLHADSTGDKPGQNLFRKAGVCRESRERARERETATERIHQSNCYSTWKGDKGNVLKGPPEGNDYGNKGSGQRGKISPSFHRVRRLYSRWL